MNERLWKCHSARCFMGVLLVFVLVSWGSRADGESKPISAGITVESFADGGPPEVIRQADSDWVNSETKIIHSHRQDLWLPHQQVFGQCEMMEQSYPGKADDTLRIYYLYQSKPTGDTAVASACSPALVELATKALQSDSTLRAYRFDRCLDVRLASQSSRFLAVTARQAEASLKATTYHASKYLILVGIVQPGDRLTTRFTVEGEGVTSVNRPALYALCDFDRDGSPEWVVSQSLNIKPVYSIYKYDPAGGRFMRPRVYESDAFAY